VEYGLPAEESEEGRWPCDRAEAVVASRHCRRELAHGGLEKEVRGGSVGPRRVPAGATHYPKKEGGRGDILESLIVQ
jgi:hypothetical protein